MNKKGGVIIAFEGTDGGGKSTVIEIVKNRLTERYNGINLIVLKEPGGTKLGEKISLILKDPEMEIDPVAELFLFEASRAQLIGKVIKSGIESEAVIIIDRFEDSSVAYQGAGRELGVGVVKNVNMIATRGIHADMTFFFYVDPEVGLERKKEKDRMDREDASFYERVILEYLKMYGPESLRDRKDEVVRIDANLSTDIVSEIVFINIEDFLLKRGFIEGNKSRKERR